MSPERMARRAENYLLRREAKRQEKQAALADAVAIGKAWAEAHPRQWRRCRNELTIMTDDHWKTSNPADEEFGSAKQPWRCFECGRLVYANETHDEDECRLRRTAIAAARERLEKSLAHARGPRRRKKH